MTSVFSLPSVTPLAVTVWPRYCMEFETNIHFWRLHLPNAGQGYCKVIQMVAMVFAVD